MTNATRTAYFFLALSTLVDSFLSNDVLKAADRNVGFSLFDQTTRASSVSEATILRNEAKELLERAQAIRDQLPLSSQQRLVESPPNSTHSESSKTKSKVSRWNIPSETAESGGEYRLSIDIGREDGSWMDPRWGASGQRIELSLDVAFKSPSETDDAYANDEERSFMVKDNFGGKSSAVYVLETAPVARLRSGFDEMRCFGGAYRIDQAKNGGKTARFYIRTEGTAEHNTPYGDVSVPEGCLYFSIPLFGGVAQLSKKEGLVTVRQKGWHTGWRREESRIVGTFRASEITEAQQRDGF